MCWLHNVIIYIVEVALTFSLNFTTNYYHFAVSSAYYSANNMDPDHTASGFDSVRFHGEKFSGV